VSRSSPIKKRRGTAHASPEQRRGQILDAAIRCFSKAGYERATMDDVAEASGLSKGSLYRFFKSKDEILLALFEHYEERIGAAFVPSQQSPGGLSRLRSYGETAVEMLGGASDLSGVWAEFFGHRESRERMRDVYRRSRRRIAAIVREGIESGEMRDRDPVDAATTILASMEGLLLQSMVDPRFNARRRWRGVWEILEDGLRR